jgi:transposase
LPEREEKAMDMKEWAERLKQQLSEREGVGPRTRYTPEQRKQAVEYLRQRQEQGAGLEEVAQEVGLSSWTLSRWGRKASGSEATAPRGALVAVEVRASKTRPQQRGLVVHGPGGVRVEGLSLEQVGVLLRGGA